MLPVLYTKTTRNQPAKSILELPAASPINTTLCKSELSQIVKEAKTENSKEKTEVHMGRGFGPQAQPRFETKLKDSVKG